MDKIIDTAYEDISSALEENNQINGEPLYYNTMQVAKILDENDSTIRYWSKVFQSILNIKISNKMKRYTRNDIDKIKFIKHLIREDKLTLKQVKEYCSTKGFDSESGLIDVDNPLAIKTFISAITDEFDKRILEMNKQLILQQDMIKNLQNIIIQNNENIKMELSITIDEVLSEKNEIFKQEIGKLISDNLNKSSNEITEQLKNQKEDNQKISEQLEQQSKQINDNFNSIDNKMIERDVQIVNDLASRLERHRLDQEEQSNQSFFSKLFHKKR